MSNATFGVQATSVATALTIASAASAGIVGFVGDTTLEGGWYAFEDEFDVDMTVIHHGGEVYDTVYGIDVPEFNGSLDFDRGHSLRHIGYGWAAWSHGYTGEVFYNNGTSFTGYDLNMDDAYAFDAYLNQQTGSWQWFDVTAYGSAGGEVTVSVDVSPGQFGANHFGFYATGETIVRIEIQATTDWAIGEWRVGVPAPGVLTLFGFAGVCRRRRRGI